MGDVEVPHSNYKSVSSAFDGAGHFVGVTYSGSVHTWGRSGHLGRLGRPGPARRPAEVLLNDQKSPHVKAVKGYAGGTEESGHTAILDSAGFLWFCGCDRWQQLGLGSANGGAAGYTWRGGKIWQEQFQRNNYLMELLKAGSRVEIEGMSSTMGSTEMNLIRDVALGAEHTVVLSANRRDVYAFGKGGEGQLGLQIKPFVSAPARSPELSISPQATNPAKGIAAVCAIQHCSLTLDGNGDTLKKAGKCRMNMKAMTDALASCRKRAVDDGLISPPDDRKTD